MIKFNKTSRTNTTRWMMCVALLIISVTVIVFFLPRNSGPDPMQLDFRLLFPVGDWWTGRDRYDFTAFDLAVEQASKHYPDVKFFVQVSTHPPKSWADENPGEMALTEDGRISRHINIGETPHSFSSKVALEDKRKAVAACIQYLEHSPYAGRIAGYNPARRYAFSNDCSCTYDNVITNRYTW